MKRRTLGAFVLALMLLLCACGTSTPHTTEAGLTESATLASGQKAPVAAATEETETSPEDVTSEPESDSTEPSEKPATVPAASVPSANSTVPAASVPPTTSTVPAVTTCDHDYQAATCTTPRTCTKCGDVMGLALGHEYGGGKCIRCGVDDPFTWSREEGQQIVDLIQKAYSAQLGLLLEPPMIALLPSEEQVNGCKQIQSICATLDQNYLTPALVLAQANPSLSLIGSEKLLDKLSEAKELVEQVRQINVSESTVKQDLDRFSKPLENLAQVMAYLKASSSIILNSAR